MGELKKAMDLRNQQWELYWDFRDSLNEKTETYIVKKCVEVLENALNFLLTHKLVEREWTAILGKNGLLNDMEMKAEMAKGFGLLTNHHIRLFQQIGEIQRAFEVGATGFEEELVTKLANQFVLPENTYLPRKAVDDDSEGYIRWNPFESAKNTRGRFIFVMDYLYFDLLNRTTFFDTDSPLPVEEVSLSTVLQEQEDRYWEFIGNTRQREADLALELKIALKTEKFIQEMDKDILSPVESTSLKQKKEANQEDRERLQKELDELTELKKNTTESWEQHRKNFGWIVEEVEKEMNEGKEMEQSTNLIS